MLTTDQQLTVVNDQAADPFLRLEQLHLLALRHLLRCRVKKDGEEDQTRMLTLVPENLPEKYRTQETKAENLVKDTQALLLTAYDVEKPGWIKLKIERLQHVDIDRHQ